jgi:hypothetical protein
MRTTLLLLLLATECGEPPPFEPPRRLLAERHVAGYTVRFWDELLEDKCYWPSRMEILRGGVCLYDDWTKRFSIGNRWATDATLPPGRDLTGNGLPNLVISKDHGGAKANVDLLLFELGPRLRLVTTLPISWAEARFTDIDGDGVPEVVTQDTSYASWPVACSTCPRPQVVLRLAGDRYVPAPDLMRRRVSFADVRERAAAVRAADWQRWRFAPEELWVCPLDLMYSGNGALARRFIDEAWPPGRAGRDKFVADLEHEVAESPYRDVVDPLGG